MSKANSEIATFVKETPIQAMAARLSVDPDEMKSIIMQTVMPNKGQNVTHEQFVAFLTVANAYGLDPLKKEIYAFPNKGAIQPIVSIDGWLLIINSRKEYDGMELVENIDTDGKIFSVTCTIYRKDHTHPTVITEYLTECVMGTDPWKKKPIRMLRHKATIQCARYAFGLSGIMDEDDGYALEEKDITPGDTPVSSLRKPEPEIIDAEIEPDDVDDASDAPEPAEIQPMTFTQVIELISVAANREELAEVMDQVVAQNTFAKGTEEHDKIKAKLKAKKQYFTTQERAVAGN